MYFAKYISRSASLSSRATLWVGWGGVTFFSLALSSPFCSVGTLLLAFEHDGISLDLWRRVGGLIMIATGILYVFLVRAFVVHTFVSLRFETADRANHTAFRRLRRERGFERLSLFSYGDIHFVPFSGPFQIAVKCL